MNNLFAQIQGLAAVISSAELVVQKFQVIREQLSDDLWEEINQGGPLADLMDAISELEESLDRD